MEPAAQIEKIPTENNVPKYNSNPFTLAFDAMGRMFSSNAGWAVAVIIAGILGFFWQILTNAAQFINSEEASASSIGQLASGSSEATTIIAMVILIGTIISAVILVSVVIGTYIQGMFTYVALQSETNTKVGFKEAFDATSKRFKRLFLAQLLANLKIIGWTFVFILPGIVASFRYALLPFVIMSDPESEKGVGTSHDKTKALVKGRLWEVFGVSTVGGIVPVVGSLLELTGNAALHNQLKLYNENNLEKPKIHWLNYIAFIVVGGIVAIVALVALLVFAISSRG